MVPDPYSVPPGCSFNPRCSHAIAGLCDVDEPPEMHIGDQVSRCHIADRFVHIADRPAEEPIHV